MTATDQQTYEVIPAMKPGGAEWLRVMSASKVSAILGLSPFDSRYSMFMRMAGLIPPEGESDVMSRGHYVEPAIAAWFADQHPELQVVNTQQSYRSLERPWMVATPDRILFDPETGEVVTALECKSDGARDWEWGPSGSDIIPTGYRVQVMWTMDVLGLTEMRVAALLPYLTFREYTIPYDPEDALLLRSRAAAFMDELEQGHAPSPDDGSDATYEAVRQYRTGITDTTYDVDDDTAVEYIDSAVELDRAKTRHNTVKTVLLDAMGTARAAVHNKRNIATRQTRGNGNPFLVIGRGLIEKETK
ncbi:lambda-exonuclease family protein [Occultella kanbiaonis]|uniref:lambda-exonuclease family protein n=1 Tax=Occultella kanbiaonis TaxID=2675754 RepID=UPI0013D3B847|nr:YqaJ viral recombinase family protein [Occultella kanbiaonis]